MKRSDIEVGTVYAFQENRSMADSYAKPVLILSTELHKSDRAHHGFLPATGYTKPQKGSGWQTPVGMPALTLAFDSHDPEFDAKLARVRELVPTLNLANANWYERVFDGDEVLAQFILVVNMAYLVDEYGAWTQRRDEAKATRDAYADEAERKSQVARARYDALAARLKDLCITPAGSPGTTPTTMLLSLDSIEYIVSQMEMHD